MTERKRRARYQTVWDSANSLPAPCHWCGLDVTAWGTTSDTDGIIHHIDHDRKNNALENLAAGHHSCHLSHHKTSRIVTEEQRTKISASLKGVKKPPRSAEYRANISTAQRGKTIPQDQRDRIAATLRARHKSRG